MSYIEELNERMMLELTEIVLFCHTCEFRALELLKVATCIFNREEFFAAVSTYTKFKSNMDIFEKVLLQVDEPISMLQVVVIKSMINQLKDDFKELVDMLEIADLRIDEDQIDFDGASILNDLIDTTTFDVVDFDDFIEALSAKYVVIYLAEEHDGTSETYGDLTVLKMSSFNTKKTAYTYALKSGISRDMVWHMYS